jgi:hypothetical protein
VHLLVVAHRAIKCIDKNGGVRQRSRVSERTNTPSGTSEHRYGDKVRIRGPAYAGARGLVSAVYTEGLEVRLDDGNVLRLSFAEITNYSLAARRAWAVMPKRSGRRPRSANKKMVSFRLDGDVAAQVVWRMRARQ